LGVNEILVEGMPPLPELPVMQVVIKVRVLGILQHLFLGVIAFLLVPHLWVDVILVVVLWFVRFGHGPGSEFPDAEKGLFVLLAVGLGFGVVVESVNFGVVIEAMGEFLFGEVEVGVWHLNLL
jgi:hypothetical protein